MIVLILMATVLVVIGVYSLLVGFWRQPIKQKALQGVSTKKTKARVLDTLFLNIAKKIAPVVKLNSFTRVKLARALESIQSPLSPEEYTANIIVSTGAMIALGLLAGIISIYISIAIFIYVYLTYSKHSKRVFYLYYNKRNEIEAELPRFVAFVDQKLDMKDTNVLAILEEYKLTDNLAFVTELEHTLADMHTSSFENGLLRLSQRISSEQLTMVVRGLLGLVRGEEQGIYFKMLKNDLNKLEINALKSKALQRQKKISRYSFMLLAALLITIITPLAIVIVDSFSKLFG